MITLWSCSLVVISTFLVMLFQYIETGEWLVFFKVQQSWNRTLNLPTLPFTTLSGIRMLWLDGLAFFVTVVAFLLCSQSLLRFVLDRKPGAQKTSSDFSLAYLAMMGIVCSFFSGVWEGDSGTSLMSLNRYVFAGPFLVFFIHRFCFTGTSSERPPKIWLLMLAIFTWLLLGAYGKLTGHAEYWQTLLYFASMTIYLFLYYFVKSDKRVCILLYIINALLQVYLFNTFLSNRWVG
jgi:hypothetical protein